MENLLMNTFFTELLKQPYVLEALLATGFALVTFILYVVILNLLNIHKNHFVATITFPEITEAETEQFIEKMRVAFDSLHRIIMSQTNSVFIELLRSRGYIQMQIGSNDKRTLELAKKSFSQVDHIAIQDSQIDQFIALPNMKAKSIYTSKAFYPITKNIYFFDSLINLLSSMPKEEAAGVQFILRGVKKNFAMDREIGAIDRRKQSQKRLAYTIQEDEKITQYGLKKAENIFKTKLYVFATNKHSLSSLVALFSSLNNRGNNLYSYRGLSRNIKNRFLAPDTWLSLWFPIIRELEGNYLTSSELAALFHPTSKMSGNYASKKTRDIEASPEFLEDTEETILIGTTETKQGETRNMYLPVENLPRHVYCLGKTGRGKSSFLNALASDIINKERGTVIIVDPHGDFLEDVIKSVKKLQNIVYFNIKNRDSVFTINPLFCFRKSESEKAVMKDKLLTIIKQETEEQTGNYQSGTTTQNRMEEILDIGIEFADAYYAYLIKVGKTEHEAETLVHERQLTLNDLPYIFDKDVFYIAMLQKIFKDVETITGMYVMHTLEKHANNQMVVDAVQVRFKQLLHSSLQYVFEGNNFDIEKAMHSGKAFLIPIPDSEFGDHGARGLMQILYSMLWTYKKEVKKTERKDTYVFIDECQKIQISAIDENLSEGRKYKNYLILANQQLGQLKPAIKNAILGNVGTLTAFTLSAGEIGAEAIAKEFGGTVTEKDLTMLPAHRAYMLTERHALKDTVPFSFSTIPLEEQEKAPQVIEKINEASLLEYGEEKATLKRNIYQKRTNAKKYFTEGI